MFILGYYYNYPILSLVIAVTLSLLMHNLNVTVYKNRESHTVYRAL